MKLVSIISDTHCLHNRIKFSKPCDLLLHCGDMTNNATIPEFRSIIKWYKELKSNGYVKNIVSIMGNHDIKINNFLLNEFKEVSVCLDDEIVEVDGFKIWGSPYLVKRGKLLNKVTNDLDFLLTHTPPKGILDNGYGCLDLLKKVEQTKPRFHCFGHIHNHFGLVRRRGINYVNASGGKIDVEIEMDKKAIAQFGLDNRILF
jgi:Icc-related predicted phosphoesterase